MQTNLGIWQLLTDINASLDLLEKAKVAYKNEPEPRHLIGQYAQPGVDVHAKRDRACFAASVIPEKNTIPSLPTIFELVCDDENREPMDVQWALITLIAVDENVREQIASCSPAPAAKLVRSTPEKFERYLLGSETCAAATAYEAVCDYTALVSLTYSSIKRN